MIPLDLLIFTFQKGDGLREWRSRKAGAIAVCTGERGKSRKGKQCRPGLRRRNRRACKAPITQRPREGIQGDLFSQFHFEPVWVPALFARGAGERAVKGATPLCAILCSFPSGVSTRPVNYSLEQHVLVSFMGTYKKDFSTTYATEGRTFYGQRGKDRKIPKGLSFMNFTQQ